MKRLVFGPNVHFAPNHVLCELLLQGCAIVESCSMFQTIQNEVHRLTYPHVFMVLLKCPKDIPKRVSDAGTEFTPTFIISAYYLSPGQSWNEGKWLEWQSMSTSLQKAKKYLRESERQHRKYLSTVKESVSIN